MTQARTGAHFVAEWLPLSQLRAHPRNYQRHPPDQLAHIERSIELHGFYRNVVAARDGTILAGHGVCEATAALGLETVPVIRLDIDADDPRALQVLTGDNEIGNMAEVDDRALTELLRELANDDLENLLGTGFDELSLAALAMVTRPVSELADLDEAAEWLGLPAFETPDAIPSLTVRFDSAEDRQSFLDKFGFEHVRRQGGGWVVWWPDRPQNDIASVRFE